MSSDFELVELVLSVRFHALLSVLPHYKKSGGGYESLIQSGLLNVLSTKASLAIEAQQYQVITMILYFITIAITVLLLLFLLLLLFYYYYY